MGDELGTVSPRRTVLDKLLVDAAVEAGAELWEGVTVKELLREDSRVIGVAGHDEAGRSVEQRAPVVIGADGTHSTVAKLVQASVYDERPGRGSGYYAYFSGLPRDAVELGFAQGYFCGVFPTNEGQACVFAGKADERFSEFKGHVDGAHAEVVRVAVPYIGERLTGAERKSRFFAFRTIPGFFRVPFGPGWALVGDAGYHKDPVTGHGITDAFRDAELVANAVHEALDGEPWDQAFGRYQRRRDEIAKELYETTQEIAALGWDEDRLLEVFMRFAMASAAEDAAIAAFG